MTHSTMTKGGVIVFYLKCIWFNFFLKRSVNPLTSAMQMDTIVVLDRLLLQNSYILSVALKIKISAMMDDAFTSSVYVN